MAYLTLEQGLARAKERSGATAADDAYLTELLALSAGVTLAGVIHYRPFYCAAKWIEQNQGAQALTEADGVKFTGFSRPIRSLFDLQAAYDLGNNLIIPEGFEAHLSPAASVQPRRSRSISPTLGP